jgi:hypothetical protein
MPRLPGNMDVICQPLYDKLTVLAAGTTSLRFFSTPIGQAAKTLSDTNMTIAGMLPSPQSFQVYAIAIKLSAAVITADAKLIVRTGVLDFQIGAKSWFQIPLELTSGGAGLAGMSDLGAATPNNTVVTNGTPDPRAMIVLTKPINILENENFAGVVSWPAAITPSVNVDMFMVLHGELTRSVQ